jgi:flavin reductase (DIM6/NTAB) family NADH-FMN oxidoreductase RutF
MKKLLRNLLFGEIPVTEYSTVTVEREIHEKVWLKAGGSGLDISVNHWLLCLDPVVFGIWLTKKEDNISFERGPEYRMYFKDSEKKDQVVADLKLELFDTLEETDGTLLLLKLKDVDIHHISFIRTRLIFYKYYRKPEQDFYKLKSFSAAYSYPRRVRIISFKEGSWYNIFPMDLVGDIPMSRRYVFGLRHSNVTLARIIATGKLVVSEVPYEYKDTIYQLGKHHRKPMSEATLPFGLIQSETFGFPVPEWANSYKEISIVRHINLGSHMLLWGEEVNQKYISDPRGHLYHIHFLHYLHQHGSTRAYPLV